jgi:RAB6A-GEF complex partner protein 1
VLDEEVDSRPSPENALLPAVLSFLSSFPQYLDILVQCTRKTEVRSWRTLFAYLPPAQELFEESLQRGMLKTAGGYLLVLQTLEELGGSGEQIVRLLERAAEEEEWELCKELARFLAALDDSGKTLREAMEKVNLSGINGVNGRGGSPSSLLMLPSGGRNGSRRSSQTSVSSEDRSPGSTASPRSGAIRGYSNNVAESPTDYFGSVGSSPS